jgi:hypothetical protein
VAATWIVEAVDVFKNCHLSLSAGFPSIAPDQFRFDGFEKRLNSAFATHRHFEAVLSKDLLIVVRTILRPKIRVMNASFGWLPERDDHL